MRAKMCRFRFWKVAAGVAAFLAVAGPLELQAQQAQRVVVDSITVQGNGRVARTSILTLLSFEVGDTIGYRDIAEGQKQLWRTRQFSDLRVFAEDAAVPGRALIRVQVAEHPLIRRVVVQGLRNADPDLVEDSAGLRDGTPYNPQGAVRVAPVLRQALSAKGIPFARIEQQQVPVEGLNNVIDFVVTVDEGNRVALADVVVEGNSAVSDEDIIAAMTTRPEGFWWFQDGTYDEDRYDLDLQESIPDLYRSRGYLDAEIVADTLIIDPETGKARLEVQVVEGLQYRIAELDFEGNEQFDDARLEEFFRPRRGGLLASLGLSGGAEEAETIGRVFDAVAFEQAQEEIRQMYYNEGYIFAQMRPVIERLNPDESGGEPTVALSLAIQEGQPAFVNRILIEGNDYTYERVIRDQIVMLPGDVYSQDRVLQSYQSINALGFFETPLPFPDIDADPETGEVDITFRVNEQQTGSINFGTSVGGGIGLSGFIGYDQPNLFGQAKEGHLRWDFGRWVNNFTLSYTDPQLFETRTTGTVSLFNARDRFFSFQSGQRRRLGGSLRFGFPIPGALRTRLFVGYSLSRTSYDLSSSTDDQSLFGLPPGTQSQFSLGITRSTLNHPIFPTVGSRQSWNVEFNGGVLGGDGAFTRHLVEGTWWLPVGELGGGGGGRPIYIALGTRTRAGGVFGNADAFPFDRFWMGGVQFGEALRGYDETSITPQGFFAERAGGISDINRLGNAYLFLGAELALRLNDNISISGFLDAGNVWADPLDIDPTQLYRGAGIGLQLVTPFGPIGLDYAYGFDKTVPGWQFHFRMGPGF
jgi:outer membrane protein insertion porin family